MSYKYSKYVYYKPSYIHIKSVENLFYEDIKLSKYGMTLLQLKNMLYQRSISNKRISYDLEISHAKTGLGKLFFFVKLF